ncbi:jg26164 [Pararge aegeria aegeria]|uniref:Jg26164 protein n=1 Tax=Pararge aegeria aegeria TaxID=348720 RepID=A0A8S4QE72_9NEOP|nr:jg26164 [Pararge aegeria aegeria]
MNQLNTNNQKTLPNSKKPTNPNSMIQQTLYESMFTRNRSNSTSSLPTKLNYSNYNQQNKEKDNLDSQTDTLPIASDDLISDHEEWQRDEIPTRRKKRKETSPIHNDVNKKQKNSPDFVIPTRNSFELLDTEPTNKTNNTDKVYVPKPEPIFVTGVINVNSLKDVLNKFVKSDLYLMTTLRSGHVIKIIPKDIQTYKTIRENFIADNISHYTYQLKSERAYRVVLRGLHASENTTEISEELYEIGHEVRQIVNIRHRATKEPLPVFYVDLEPKPNNKAIFDVKYLNNMKITFEAPYKKKEIIQCKRCQRFGHSKNQCFRPYRCVKCGSAHPTTTCTKKPDTEATCANCDEKHPASYKGCKVYKQYRERILKLDPKTKETPMPSNIEMKNPGFHPGSKPNCTDNQNLIKTYSEATKTKKQYTQKNIKNDLADLTDLMDIMFEKLQHSMLTMMEKIMDKMMDRMVQLVSSLVKK